MSDLPKANLHFFSGKGGVGKTTIATLFALHQARNGKRVLLAEIDADHAIPALLGCMPTHYTMREIIPDLFLINITPWEALQEYARILFHLPFLHRSIFEHPAVIKMLHLIPNLPQVLILGKLLYHMDDMDCIVVDAPSTGHLKALLSTPTAVLETVKEGPLAREVRKMQHILATSSKKSFLHIVTQCEEMALQESHELACWIEMLQPVIALGTSIVNMHSTPLSEQAWLHLKPESPHSVPIREVLDIHQKRALADASLLAEWHDPFLQEAIYFPLTIIPQGKIPILQELADKYFQRLS